MFTVTLAPITLQLLSQIVRITIIGSWLLKAGLVRTPSARQSTVAYKEFIAQSSRLRYRRDLHGDRLGHRNAQRAAEAPQKLFVRFRSVLQGDHAGVDVATCSHAALLSSYGLLRENCRLRSSKPLESREHCEGLCVDDYFALSIVKTFRHLSRSLKPLRK